MPIVNTFNIKIILVHPIKPLLIKRFTGSKKTTLVETIIKTFSGSNTFPILSGNLTQKPIQHNNKSNNIPHSKIKDNIVNTFTDKSTVIKDSDLPSQKYKNTNKLLENAKKNNLAQCDNTYEYKTASNIKLTKFGHHVYNKLHNSTIITLPRQEHLVIV
jgi:hypothetical protein